MLSFGPVVFNIEYLGFWIAIALWIFMHWSMPKRAKIGLVLGALACIVHMSVPHTDPEMGQYFVVGGMFFMGFIFTCMMSPLAMFAFFLGYKTTR